MRLAAPGCLAETCTDSPSNIWIENSSRNSNKSLLGRNYFSMRFKGAESRLNYAAAVQKLASVRELILYGEGASATLTYLLEFRFRRFGYRVTRINESGRYFFDAVLNLPRDGAAVVCGLGRPPRERQFFLRRAKKCGNTTILITDSSVSGLRAGADYVLPVAGRSVGVFQSLVMPTLIAEALALGVAVEKREEIMDSFQELDDLRREFGYPNIGGLLWR